MKQKRNKSSLIKEAVSKMYLQELPHRVAGYAAVDNQILLISVICLARDAKNSLTQPVLNNPEITIPILWKQG